MRIIEGAEELAEKLEIAHAEGRVRYIKVHAAVEGSGESATFGGVRVNEFDLLARREVTLGTVTIGRSPGDQALPRLIYRPAATADPSLPAGYGVTNKYGDYVYSTQGSPNQQALARYHEQVHSVLSPKLSVLREWRADLRVAGYKRSHFLRYLEEALAETHAQLRVNGFRGLPSAIQFPLKNNYQLRVDRILSEGAIGTVAVGGVTYGVYYLASKDER